MHCLRLIVSGMSVEPRQIHVVPQDNISYSAVTCNSNVTHCQELPGYESNSEYVWAEYSDTNIFNSKKMYEPEIVLFIDH